MGSHNRATVCDSSGDERHLAHRSPGSGGALVLADGLADAGPCRLHVVISAGSGISDVLMGSSNGTFSEAERSCLGDERRRAELDGELSEDGVDPMHRGFRQRDVAVRPTRSSSRRIADVKRCRAGVVWSAIPVLSAPVSVTTLNVDPGA
jgi:hypothetical protein